MSLKYAIRNFVRNHIPESMVVKYKMAHSTRYPIVKNPLDYFELIYHIKDDTWEPLHMPEIYQMSKPYDLEVFHGRQDILLVPNAQVSDNSDIVITDHGVVWDKYYAKVFSKTKGLDKDYISHNEEYIVVRNGSAVENVQGSVLSMLGKFEDLWSHFLVQFLPKLYYAEEAGLLDKEVTIILPQYKDKQVAQLVQDVLKNHPQVNVLHVDGSGDRITYVCERLYYIPTASSVSNHTYFESFYDSVIPQRVQDVLRKNVVVPYVEKIKNNPCKYEKVYFIRRSFRTAENISDIEQFFVDKGFYMLDPGTLTLEEKVNILYHAKEIAGPASSAWSNVIFCNGSIALLLNTLSRVTDSFSRFLMPVGNVHAMMLTGCDLGETIHANYIISLDELKKAYEQMCRK